MDGIIHGFLHWRCNKSWVWEIVDVRSSGCKEQWMQEARMTPYTERNAMSRKTWSHQSNTLWYLPSIVRRGVLALEDVTCTQNQYEYHRYALLYCRLWDLSFLYRLLSAKIHSLTVMSISNDIRLNTRKVIHASATITNHRQIYQKDCYWLFVNVSISSSIYIALKTIERISKINSRGL